MSSKRALSSSPAAERTFVNCGGGRHDFDNECIDARHTEGYRFVKDSNDGKT